MDNRNVDVLIDIFSDFLQPRAVIDPRCQPGFWTFLLACTCSSPLGATPLTLGEILNEGRRTSPSYLQVAEQDAVASAAEAFGLAAASPRWAVAISPLVSSALSSSLDDRWKDFSSSVSASLSLSLPGEASVQTSLSDGTTLDGVGSASPSFGFSPSGQVALTVPLTWDNPPQRETLAVQDVLRTRFRAALDRDHGVAVWERQMAGWYFQTRSALRGLKLQQQKLAYYTERASAAEEMRTTGAVSVATLWDAETELDSAREARFLAQWTWQNAARQLSDELGRDLRDLDLAEDLPVLVELPAPGTYGQAILDWERSGQVLATERRLYSQSPVLTSSLSVAPHGPPGVPPVLPFDSAWESWTGSGAGLAANWSLGISWTGTMGGLSQRAKDQDTEEAVLLDQRIQFQSQAEARRRASAQQQWSTRLQVSHFYSEAYQRSSAMVVALGEQADRGLTDAMTVWQGRLKAGTDFNKWMDAEEALILMVYDEKVQ